MGISIANYRGNSSAKFSVKTNSGEYIQYTSPRNKLYNTDYLRKDFRFDIEGPTRKELKKTSMFPNWLGIS